ncbi:MAG: flagellar protein FlgN [Phycisphaeraceae bacterium]
MDERTTRTANDLEHVLRQLVEANGQLLGLLQQKRAALAGGLMRQVPGICSLENEKLQQIAELEKQRIELAGRLTAVLRPDAAEPLRLGELAELLGEPAGGRLLVLRAQLIAKVREVQHASSIVRRASETLMRHVRGLVQTIGAVSTGVTTYGRTGALPRQAMAMSTINTTA